MTKKMHILLMGLAIISLLVVGCDKEVPTQLGEARPADAKVTRAAANLVSPEVTGAAANPVPRSNQERTHAPVRTSARVPIMSPASDGRPPHRV
ncbi:hypothetical protein IH970_13830 [candidate division KSB1 bacterium]|nr:hypothetical protein [candidate division KSB1 bacterium]